MESSLINHTLAARTIPPQPIQTPFRAFLFYHNADGIRETNGVVGRVGRQKEHGAFVDDDVAEVGLVDYFEQHGAAVLVEPFGGFVDVVVGAGVGAAYDHYCDIFIIDAVVVNRWFEEMGVFFEPFWDVQWSGKHFVLFLIVWDGLESQSV